MASHAAIGLSSSFERADTVEVTKVWLDGSRQFQEATFRGPRVGQLVKHLESAERVTQYACGPATPKYVVKFQAADEILGEVRVRETLIQIGNDAAAIESREFLKILEDALRGAKKQPLANPW